MHKKSYNKGVQLRPETNEMIYVQTKAWKELVQRFNNAGGGPNAKFIDTRTWC